MWMAFLLDRRLDLAINILIVEDSPHKVSKVSEHLLSLEYDVCLTKAYSFTSGWQALEVKKFDLILMDMSLPTYDRRDADPGGRFRPFGGRELARKLVRRGIKSTVVFLTQYESFSDKAGSHTFNSLREELIRDCGELFGGMIFYDSSKLAWKEELLAVFKKNII